MQTYFKAIDCETGDLVVYCGSLEAALSYARDHASLTGRMVRVQDHHRRVYSLVRPD